MLAVRFHSQVSPAEQKVRKKLMKIYRLRIACDVFRPRSLALEPHSSMLQLSVESALRTSPDQKANIDVKYI
jgi:hypothetical protein